MKRYDWDKPRAKNRHRVRWDDLITPMSVVMLIAAWLAAGWIFWRLILETR
jgi:hypothetical protein